MKKYLVTLFICLFSLTVYGETFYGTYSGPDHGKWCLYVNDSDPDDSCVIVWSDVYQTMNFGTAYMEENTLHAYLLDNVQFDGYINEAGAVTGDWSQNGRPTGYVDGRVILPEEVDVYNGSLTRLMDTGQTLDLVITGGIIHGNSPGENRGFGMVTPGGYMFLRDVDDLVGMYGNHSRGVYYNKVTSEHGSYGPPPTDSSDDPVIDGGNGNNGGCFIGSLL